MTTFPASSIPCGPGCTACNGPGHGFCSELDGESLARFTALAHPGRYAQGEEIAPQGTRLDRIGVIASGMVKIVALTESGEEYVLQLLHPGQLVGNAVPEQAGCTWEAAADTTVCWMPSKAWREFLNEQPQRFEAFLHSISHQLEDAWQTALRMRGRKTVQRIAYWLLEQVSDRRLTAGQQVHIPLSRRDLASLLDMTSETLCRALQQLVARKAIRLLAPDQVEIADPARLRLLAKWSDPRIDAALGRTGQAASQRVGGNGPQRSGPVQHAGQRGIYHEPRR